MSKHLVTYRFKLKPSVKQNIKLFQWLGTCRYIYNYALEQKIKHYEKTAKTLSKSDLQTQIRNLAKEHEWVGEVQSQVRQDEAGQGYQ